MARITFPAWVRDSIAAELESEHALDELFALHRAQFGLARMDTDPEADPADPEDPEADPADPEDPEADPADPEDPDKPLGPKGEKALAAEKEKRRQAQAELRKFKDLGLTPEQIKALTKPKEGEDPSADQIRTEAQKAADKRANERIIKSEAKAAAAGRLSPGAHELLDLSGVEVDDDGNVAESDLEDAIDALLAKFPGLAAQGGKRFQGTGDNGPRNGDRAKKTQLTEADLQGMSAKEINEARRAGRLDKVMGKS